MNLLLPLALTGIIGGLYLGGGLVGRFHSCGLALWQDTIHRTLGSTRIVFQHVSYLSPCNTLAQNIVTQNDKHSLTVSAG